MSLDVSNMTAAEKAYHDNLRAQKYTESHPRIRTFRGKQVKEVHYTKSDDERFGKIPSVAGRGLLGVVGSAASLGLLNFSETFREQTWGKIKDSVTSDEPLVGAKTARLAGGIAGSALTLGLANISKDFRNETLTPVIKGKVEEVAYYDAGIEEDTSKLGYDPKKREEIGAFMQSRAEAGENLRRVNGYVVYIEDRRPGLSCYLRVPAAEFEKGIYTHAESVKVWHSADGSSIVDQDHLERHINFHTKAHSSGDEERAWNEAVDMIALRLAKREDKGDDENRIEELKKEIKAKEHIVKYNYKLHCYQFFSTLDLNETKTDSYLAGTLVPFGKELSKYADVVWNQNLTENKLNIAGEAYKYTPPKAPVQDLPDA